MTRRHSPFRPWHVTLSCSTGLLAGMICGFDAGEAAAQATRRSSQVQVAYAEMPSGSAPNGTVHRDSQVVPAGAHLLHKRQRVCPQGGCGPNGQCQGTCVVRPGRFGYYATQWRAWPGDGGVQQTSLQEMTPVSPPASAIPSVDEEALMPSSLMPEDDDTAFGSDNFGFEEVVPSPPAPQLPPPGLPQERGPAPGGLTPDPADDNGTPPTTPQNPSLFDEDSPAEKPSLFDDPATPPAEPATPDAPEGEEKPKESLDNLFDDFGRASQLHNDRLRQRLAVANQQAARRQAEKQTTARVDAWMPRQLPSSETSRPLSQGPSRSQPSLVVPTSAEQRAGSRSNPLR